jgi:predicted ATPase
MSDSPNVEFVTTELDPDLLSTPFATQINWHVITGGPCSGKTTLIDRLADRGFQTVPETARLYVEGEMDRGRTIDEIRADARTLERGLIEMQLRFERALCTTEVAFLDRGLPDGLAYCRLAGLDPNEILPECFHHRYASVFLLDPLPMEPNCLRTEEEATEALLDKCLERDYRARGYDTVRLPIVSPEERLAYLCHSLAEGSAS